MTSVHCLCLKSSAVAASCFCWINIPQIRPKHASSGSQRGIEILHSDLTHRNWWCVFFSLLQVVVFPRLFWSLHCSSGVYHIEANIFKWESEQIYSKYSSGKKVILPYLHQNYNFSINYLLHHVPKTILKACYSYVPILKYTSEWYFVVSTFYFPSLCFPYYHK